MYVFSLKVGSVMKSGTNGLRTVSCIITYKNIKVMGFTGSFRTKLTVLSDKTFFSLMKCKFKVEF